MDDRPLAGSQHAAHTGLRRRLFRAGDRPPHRLHRDHRGARRLPADGGGLFAGALLVVIDESGACSPVKTIAATAVGSDTINGAASAVIASAYGSLTLESNGVAAWTIVDAFAPTYSEAVYVRALGVNLNALGDTQVAIPPPSAGITRYRVGTVYVENASTSLTTAKLGMSTAASQGGVAIVGSPPLVDHHVGCEHDRQ